MLRTADNAEKFAVAGDVYAFLATADDTAGAYSLIEASVPPGGGPPLHTQQDTELFYVLRGRVTFTVDGRETVAGPGTFLSVQPGVPHAFQNRDGEPARMLIQTYPAGIDRYFRAVGRPADSMEDHRPPTREELDTLVQTAPKFGIHIFPPE